MMHFNRRHILDLVSIILIVLCSCNHMEFDDGTMKAIARKLAESEAFRYPLDNYFPEIPVTGTDPPKGERHHTAEDSFVLPGTPVYAIGDGIIHYSGYARGYGGLIIIDHPSQNVYSLYSHLSLSRWIKESGEVKKGELIAYIGKAEECHTMVSHIHFGLRMGQKADYPRWGDARWSAGYTYSRPTQHGWFELSKIIGQTDSMKTWHRYIRKREDIVTGRRLYTSEFRITSEKYDEKENLDQIITKEFGNQYRLADWKDILPFRENIEEWADSVGLAEGEENSLLISNEGYRIWLGRQYYISRFNHNKPDHFLSFDAMDDNFVCLGSWFGVKNHVLAVKM